MATLTIECRNREMSETAKFEYVISDERYGETCLIGNLAEFVDSMENTMFEFDYENDASEDEQKRIWRDDLEEACIPVEPVQLPDGRTGYTYEWTQHSTSGRGETRRPVYVEAVNGLASYAGDLSDLMEGNED